MITAHELKSVLDYKESTGEFFYRTHAGPNKPGDKACSLSVDKVTGRKHLRICINGRHYLSHRLAWLYVNGGMPDGEIDHINHDSTDNRISNLRLASRGENAKNKSLSKNNKSGVIGVCFDASRNKWIATIPECAGGKRVIRRDDFFEAVCARKSIEALFGFHANHGRKKIS